MNELRVSSVRTKRPILAEGTIRTAAGLRQESAAGVLRGLQELHVPALAKGAGKCGYKSLLDRAKVHCPKGVQGTEAEGSKIPDARF